MAQTKAAWQGRTTIPELFIGSVKDWGNNAYLGQRLLGRDGTPGSCFEWESYRQVRAGGKDAAATAAPDSGEHARWLHTMQEQPFLLPLASMVQQREVELSVLAVARSLRCVLPEVVQPGMAAAIMGPATIEAVKIWQACCHLSAAPLLLPGDGSITSRQLRHLLLQPTGATAAFVHESSLARLAEALQSSAEGSAASTHRLQLVVVWGAGGIRFTQPDAALAAALTAAGVGRVVGFEDFKRSHFNGDPEAAFTELLLPGPEHIAAVVAMVQPKAGAAATDEAGGGAGAGVDGTGLQLETVTHGELVAAAAQLLGQQFPRLEATSRPYVPEEQDGSGWQGRPDFPTGHLVDPSAGLASLELLTRLAAITAAAGRVGCAGMGGVVHGEDAAVLKPNLR